MRLVTRLLAGFALTILGATPAHAQDSTSGPHGKLDLPCETCHDMSGWKPARISSAFDHKAYGLALEGAHQTAPCASCHKTLDFGAGTPAECAACHRDVHRGELGATCARCHTTRAFTDQAAMFRAHQQTRFPLEGPHAAVDCESCHVPAPQGGLTWVNRPTECQGCHVPEFRATTDPDHVAAGFTQRCTDCHAGNSWEGGRFDHSTTQFPLVFAHAQATCADCHTNGVYRGHDQSCVACHQPDFEAAAAPPHAGFPTDCTTCHTEGPTHWTGAEFDHGRTKFPLTGAHVPVACKDCHGDNKWAGKPTTCLSCHQLAFDRTSAPPHGAVGFSTDCVACHQTARWLGAAFDHSRTAFPLTGRHQPAACAGCHKDGVYRGKATNCVSCHQADYDRVTTPNHRTSGFPTDCTQCHTTTGWPGANFNHDATAFPLTGSHRAATCLACHGDGVYRGKSTLCASCHRSAYDQSARPPHLALTFPTDCRQCHTTSGWPGGTYNHATTRFPLTGAHLTTTCAECHGDGVYRGKPMTCVSCHQADYNGVTAPNHRTSGFPTDCTQCHTTTGWAGANFNHDATAFPLTGEHRATACLECHADGVYRGKSTLCASCHRTAYDQSTQPPHLALTFPTDCRQCHTTAGWPGGTYNHATTRFPLTGAHLATTCAQCHGDGVWRGKAMTCVSCHQADYDGVTTPNHRTSGFPTDCTQCHTTTGWAGANFNHDATAFPLTGEHRTATCVACHGNGVFRGTSTLCASCHRTAYDQSAQPPHLALTFPTDCRQCHTTTGWPGGTYDHATTRFPLTGAHRTTTCAQCHGDGVWRGKAMTCVSCHQADYDGVTTPNHRTGGFPTDCTQCHTTTGWAGANFNHDATAFPLTGAHRATGCLECHADGVYRGKSTLCVSCHRTAYDQSAQPPHLALTFPTDCRQCHTTAGWPGGTYDHATTRFPLTGAHRAATCAQCHGDGVYRGKAMTCVSCHQADYDRTTTPNHRTSGFPTDCIQCHATSGWPGANFNHDATAFPLTGAHRATTCADCHNDGVYRGKSTLCVSCHRTAYDQSAQPPHLTLSFPTDCRQCHTTTGWPGGTYDHATTRFPLTGAHRAATCAQCHGDGVYRGKAMTCASCHQGDYDGTTNPNHRTAMFPASCESCHTTATWTGATFDHDSRWFRIYSGRHRGMWSSCATCHTNSSNYTVFTCLTCHEHNQASMDSHHQGRTGYRYDSQACYSCHRNS